MNPAIVAAAVSALGSMGSSLISGRHSDAPSSKEALLDWKYHETNQAIDHYRHKPYHSEKHQAEA